MPKKLSTDATGNYFKMSLSFYVSLFGLSLMNGDITSRRVFLEVLVYLLYKVCWVSESVVYIVNSYIPLENYYMFANIYQDAPYITINHFLSYPDTYKFCGLLMFIYGLHHFINTSKS